MDSLNDTGTTFFRQKLRFGAQTWITFWWTGNFVQPILTSVVANRQYALFVCSTMSSSMVGTSPFFVWSTTGGNILTLVCLALMVFLSRLRFWDKSQRFIESRFARKLPFRPFSAWFRRCILDGRHLRQSNFFYQRVMLKMRPLLGSLQRLGERRQRRIRIPVNAMARDSRKSPINSVSA